MTTTTAPASAQQSETVTTEHRTGQRHPLWCRAHNNENCDTFDAGTKDEYTIHRTVVFGSRLDDPQMVAVEFVESGKGDYPVVLVNSHPDDALSPARARVMANAILMAADLADEATRMFDQL